MLKLFLRLCTCCWLLLVVDGYCCGGVGGGVVVCCSVSFWFPVVLMCCDADALRCGAGAASDLGKTVENMQQTRSTTFNAYAE